MLLSTAVPPSKVQNLQAPGNDLTNTSIRIQWTTPATTGGRSDLERRIRLATRRIGSEQVTMRTTTQTSYQLTGLQPLSEYTITVVSANGITEGLPNVAAITLQSRTVTISASTTEGGWYNDNVYIASTELFYSILSSWSPSKCSST